MPKFSAIETLAGRKLLVTGSTGFLGKVFLALLLDRQPKVGTLFVLVRGKRGEPADRRFFDTILASPVFQPLGRVHGDGLETFLRSRVRVLEGDVALPGCGLSAEARTALAGLDAIVHNAGLVALNPPLDESLAANARGALHIGELAVKLGAKLLHVSTAYVAGRRWGRVAEEGPARGPDGVDPRVELADCERLVRELREDAHAGFLRGAKGTRRKWLIEEQLMAEGRRLALKWNRPNVYCFTKALGEALLATVPGLRVAILRPTIVESAWRFPFPGWNEGMTTSAPIVYAMLKGHTVWPMSANTPLDVIPVDLVASASVATVAALLADRAEPVYHLGTSDTNPFRLGLCVSLVARYRRRHFQDFADGSPLAQWLKTRPAILTVPHGLYRTISAPAHRLVVAAASKALELAGLKAPRLWTKIDRELGQIDHIVGTFRPFIHDHRWYFDTGRIRALRDAMSPDDAERLPYDPERIDWRHYWPNIHIEGMRRWVFPGFEQGKRRPTPRKGAVNRRVRAGLEAFQRWLYGSYFSVRVRYASRVPSGRVLVAANHSSHLDMGLIKRALGPSGRELASLAAQDYFFRPGWRRWFFGRFTNLVAIDRRAGLKDTLRRAVKALETASILIFPEGTRSRTGAISSFKRSFGYLALKSGVDVLPVYVDGTFAAHPKGRVLLRRAALTAIVGRPITAAELSRLALGLPIKEACRRVAQRVEEAVRELERREGSRARRRALVTGATSGIGRALALGLAKRGFDLVAVGRDAAALDRLADDCRRRFEADVRAEVCDLSRPGAAAALVARVSAEASLDVVVHAAGIGLHGSISDVDPKAESELWQVNAGAAVELARAAIPALRERGEGRLLFVSSVYAFCGVPYQAAYAASKAYLWSFAQSLAEELRGTGLSVTTLAPGVTKTDFRRRAGMPDAGPVKGMSAEEVAEAGLHGLFAGADLVVPGTKNRAFVWLARRAPRAFAAAVLKRVNRARGLAPAGDSRVRRDDRVERVG